ncbi:MAG: DUF58 domain-containing protein [Planctomycetaceae bacterium]|nr:DUF58 domain-containing protein [Planctomycetaceae bacterium]
MIQDSKRSLPPEVVHRISRLEIQARGIVEGFMSGLHRSPYFGQSIEFVQHREYVTGDDIRKIDWKVWSKTDKYYIKQYEEETNLRTTLLVDISESMTYGSTDQSKLDFACLLTAALSYLLLKQQDSVGLTTFDDDIREQLPFRSKRNHLHDILHVLVRAEPRSRKTGMLSILQRVAQQRVKRGLVVVISDLFTDRDELFRGLKLLRLRGHDVMLFHVLDPQEVDFNFQGMTKFEGLEETGELVCDPKSLRNSYLQAMEAYLSEIRLFAARYAVDYRTVITTENIDAVLAHYLKHRVGMTK